MCVSFEYFVLSIRNALSIWRIAARFPFYSYCLSTIIQMCCIDITHFSKIPFLLSSIMLLSVWMASWIRHRSTAPEMYITVRMNNCTLSSGVPLKMLIKFQNRRFTTDRKWKWKQPQLLLNQKVVTQIKTTQWLSTHQKLYFFF